ncbi:MAG: glycosyltransferase, partial [Anaeroplasmataceae bacterium]|nr:glycosyltransferase [Anaeroplasmataceae bacterium]
LSRWLGDLYNRHDYISNEELAYLYRNCQAFILPSFYEGFGLPPLEALFCGCKNLILSDIPVFREIYGEVANFFNPLDYENTFDLSTLKPVSEENIKKVLQKYTWENAAKKIVQEMRQKYDS